MAQVELTTLHLIAHIAAVVPAVTLQIFWDAHSRITGKLIGTSWGKIRKTKQSTGKKERETVIANWAPGSDSLCLRHPSCCKRLSQLIRAIMNPFQSNWETTYRPREYWKQSVPWPTAANKMDPVSTLSDQWSSPVARCPSPLLKLRLSVHRSAAVTPSLSQRGSEWRRFVTGNPLLIRVWRSRVPLTHGWRDRRRCTRRWSLCRCRTRQSGISRPGRWCCWSEPRTTTPHNTWERKRPCLNRVLYSKNHRLFILRVRRIYHNRNIKVEMLAFEEKSRHFTHGVKTNMFWQS